MSRRSRPGAAFPHGTEPLVIPDGGPAPAWSARLLANGGPEVPDYDSPEWHALDDNDPRRVAATVAAAEAWRRSQHPDVLADRLRVELSAGRHVAVTEAEEAAEVARRSVAEPVAARAGRPTHAELCVQREDWSGLARAREQEERIEAGFVGLDDAFRAVHRRRRREAHSRTSPVASPATEVSR